MRRIPKENKSAICHALEDALRLTRQYSDLIVLDYHGPEITGNGEETVTAEFVNQGSVHINVTADSGAAMIRDIMRALT